MGVWTLVYLGQRKSAQLDRLMANAHRRRFDAVVVWKLDRAPGARVTTCS